MLRSFDCCLPLCLKSDWALDQVLWVHDPFGYEPKTAESRGDLWSFGEDLLIMAGAGDHIHRIDVPGEVL